MLLKQILSVLVLFGTSLAIHSRVVHTASSPTLLAYDDVVSDMEDEVLVLQAYTSDVGDIGEDTLDTLKEFSQELQEEAVYYEYCIKNMAGETYDYDQTVALLPAFEHLTTAVAQLLIKLRIKGDILLSYDSATLSDLRTAIIAYHDGFKSYYTSLTQDHIYRCSSEEIKDGCVVNDIWHAYYKQATHCIKQVIQFLEPNTLQTQL